jgi:hypothetical protein
VHDRGLVSLLRQHHDTIDARVADACGWPAGLTDEEILARLVVRPSRPSLLFCEGVSPKNRW